MAKFYLDLTAYLCPLPLFMTKKALAQLQAGDTLVIQLNVQSPAQDFIALFQQQGDQLLSQQETATGMQLIVLRSAKTGKL